MPNFIITEYDTMVSVYKVNAIDKQDAINKIAKGDIITRAEYRANGFKKEEKQIRYDVEEINNGKEKVQTIGKKTQNKENTTSTLLCTPKRTRANEVYKIS